MSDGAARTFDPEELIRNVRGISIPLDAELEFESRPGGILSDLTIVRVTSDDPPRVFLIKRRKDDDFVRGMDANMRFFQRELHFYDSRGSSGWAYTPHCYQVFGEDSRFGPTLVLSLLEGRPGDVTVGADVDEIGALLRVIASQHGRFWMGQSQAPIALDWNEAAFHVGGFPVYVESDKCIIPHDLAISMANTMIDDEPRTRSLFAARPSTFVHGDFELDNVIFADDGPALVDWQQCLKSFPGQDVALLLGSACSPSIIESGADLLDLYRRVLQESGGPEWSVDTLLEDISVGLLYWLTALGMAAAFGLDDRSQRRLDRMVGGCVALMEAWDLSDRWEKVLAD
jgi:Phosphotransferase enzyme family